MKLPFHIRHPHNWQYKVIGQLLTLFCTPQDWALIIFYERNANHSDSSSQSDYFEKYLINNQFSTNNIRSYQNLKKDLCQCSEFHDKDGRFWFIHGQQKSNQLLFACYNSCDMPNPQKSQEISKVISSLTFLQ